MEGGDGGSTWMQGSWEPVSVLADTGFTVLRKPKRVGEKNQAGGRPACSPWRQETQKERGQCHFHPGETGQPKLDATNTTHIPDRSSK